MTKLELKNGAQAKLTSLTRESVPEVTKLAREIWYFHYPGIITVAQIEHMLQDRYSEKTILADLAQKEVSWIILWLEKKIVGFRNDYYHSKSLKIDKLYVHPKYQNLGLGKGMVEEAVQKAKIANLKKIWLRVNRSNFNAICFYKSLGFNISKTSVSKIGKGFIMDDYIMVTNLY